MLMRCFGDFFKDKKDGIDGMKNKNGGVNADFIYNGENLEKILRNSTGILLFRIILNMFWLKWNMEG
jgi:hypothetical protein